MNNGVSAVPNLLNHDMLEQWPMADGEMEAVIGNRLPGFSPDQFGQSASEAFRVLKSGGEARLFSLAASADRIATALTRAGFQQVTIVGLTVIGQKPAG